MSCWEYGIDGVQIELHIIDTPRVPIWQPKNKKEFFLIDTGYAGEMTDVLIPSHLFDELELEEVPERQLEAKGMFPTGEEVDLRVSENMVYIPKIDRNFKVFINTFVGNTEYLIGVGFLKRFKLLLDGPNDKACILNQNDLLF